MGKRSASNLAARQVNTENYQNKKAKRDLASGTAPIPSNPEPSPPPSPPPPLDDVRAQQRKEFKAQIRARFGLPDDTTFICRSSSGTQDLLKLTYGTVVLLDTDGSKLIAVIRFNKRQYSGQCPDTGKRLETPESARLFANFDLAISTLHSHALARYRCRTNGASQRMKHFRRGHMFAIGYRGGYRTRIFAGKHVLSLQTHVLGGVANPLLLIPPRAICHQPPYREKPPTPL